MSIFDVRDAIERIISTTGDPEELGTRTLIARLRQDHADTVASARNELEDMALIKVINEVASRRRAAQAKPELFGRYTGIQRFITVRSLDEGGRLTQIRKPIEQVTTTELDTWLQDHSARRAAPEARYAGMRRLLSDARQVGGDKDAGLGALLAERRRREEAGG